MVVADDFESGSQCEIAGQDRKAQEHCTSESFAFDILNDRAVTLIEDVDSDDF